MSKASVMHPHAAGFTLLELSIVLVVISLMVGFSVMLGTAQVNAARTAQTYEKMNAIEKALLSYRRVYNRLPCPSSLTTSIDSSSFGLEDSAASCGSFTTLPGSTYGKSGGLPAVTLGLPPDFAFDGWGNHFQYSVDSRITGANAFDPTLGYAITSSTIGDLQVNDASGTALTAKAVYVLVSHGENGSGSYNRTGAQAYASSNADEENNCNCGMWSSTVDNIWVQKPPTGSMGDAINYFDDIVHYKLRSQLSNYDE